MNLNVALKAPVRAGGPSVMIVSGSPVVIHVYGPAGVGSTFGGSARSIARTQRLCVPDASPVSS